MWNLLIFTRGIYIIVDSSWAFLFGGGVSWPTPPFRHKSRAQQFDADVDKQDKHTSCTHHEVLACQADGLDGALDVDGGFLLGAVGVGEVDLGARPLGDVLDVAAIAAHHEEVVLGRDVQVGADRDGACQAAGQVLQQQSRAPLKTQGKNMRIDI